jgi:hypothetical protein
MTDSKFVTYVLLERAKAEVGGIAPTHTTESNCRIRSKSDQLLQGDPGRVHATASEFSSGALAWEG